MRRGARDADRARMARHSVARRRLADAREFIEETARFAWSSLRVAAALSVGLVLATAIASCHAPQSQPAPATVAAPAVTPTPAPISAHEPEPARAPAIPAEPQREHTPATGPLRDLSWLAGCWQARDGDMLVEETWTDPCTDRMLATGRTVDVNSGRTAFFEFLRIEARGDRLVYIALPRGRGETAFPATKIEAHRLRFENPEHDDPKVIEYRLEADGTLVTRVEGTRVEELRLHRVR